MTGQPARVRLTAGAERDLSGIYRRRLSQRGTDGEDGADAMLDRIVAAIETLTDWPARGPIPSELEALGIHAYRQLPLPPFRIIYLPEDKDAEPLVTVMIIADARRDFRTLLEERLVRGPFAGGFPPSRE
jgi:toxin ParE1/3/4